MLNVLTVAAMGGLTDGQIPTDQYDDEEQSIEKALLILMIIQLLLIMLLYKFY